MAATKIRVLLVDDDADHAALVRRTLERTGGYAVTHVLDGPACLETLNHETYAVVLLDYSLPRMNGLEVLERIGHLGLGLPIIMATGQGDERIAVEAMHAGAIDYVTKTSGYFATLPTVLNKVLKQHELAVDNARLYAESQRQQARLSQIFDSTSDGIALVNGSGMVLWANRRVAEFLGSSPDALRGRSLMEVVRAGCDDRPERMPDALEAFLATRGQSGEGDLELTLGERIVHWIGQPTDDGPMLRGFTITFQDVTREREISRMKSDFVSFAAHQLRTPLSGIKWMLELAAEEPGLSPALASCIAGAASSAARLLAMVGDLLDVSRLESGLIASASRETDLAGLTRAVLAELAPLITEKEHRVAVVTTPEAELASVLVDDQLLRQAMVNIVSNAVKYTPPGGEITVAIAREDGVVSWLVRDNGIGIPERAKAKISEKFYRADNAAAVDANGRGLGLYMVRLIITRFGGRICWTSEEGRGTTFGFTLPLGGTR
jgi:PAS domain S-box-containing protein